MRNETKTRWAIGIDVGGTKCAAGLVSLFDGKLLAHQVRPTRPERGGDAVLADVIELALAMQAAAQRTRVAPTAIGIGICELVGPGGQILSEATIHWRETPVGPRMYDQTQLPIVVEADVRAAASGEAHFGAGRPFRSFLYVTIGTGISASLVLNKTPYAGARGLTGTFASSRELIPSVDGALVSGPPLEQFASGPALAARLAAVRAGFDGAAPDVVALAESGDAKARTIVDSAGAALGAAIAHLVNVLDPEAVVIGGGLGLVEGRYRHALHDALRDHVWSDLHREMPLLSAELGNDAGMIGVALAAAAREEDAPLC